LTRQQSLDLARAAHQAPSIHNTQPWLFRPMPAGLAVLEDHRRSLPATDPHGRDLVISCGAAVRNAEVALARLGQEPLTVLLPDGDASPVVAEITAGPLGDVPARIEALHRAVWERRTHRRIFMGDDAEPGHLAVHDSVREAVTSPGVRVRFMVPEQQTELAGLLWQAAQQQVHDEGARSELLDWTRSAADTQGIPMSSHGTAPFPVDSLLVHETAPSTTAPPWVTDDLARGQVAVLLTRDDRRIDWVRAGIALEDLLLTLTASGRAASFLNQPVQQETFRPRLAALSGEPGWYPQAVLRIGTPLVPAPATPRRALTDVLID